MHAGDPHQEVGAAAPRTVHEGRLRDHFRAGAHRVQRTGRRGVEVPALVHRDLDHLATFGTQALEELRLVQLALFLQELRAFVRHVRLLALAARDLARERRQVPAVDVVVEVGWRKQDPAV